MGFMTIDRIRVEFTDEPNVLSVIRKADIDIPTEDKTEMGGADNE